MLAYLFEVETQSGTCRVLLTTKCEFIKERIPSIETIYWYNFYAGMRDTCIMGINLDAGHLKTDLKYLRETIPQSSQRLELLSERVRTF
jgi:hypothetical protein